MEEKSIVFKIRRLMRENKELKEEVKQLKKMIVEYQRIDSSLPY